MTRLADLGPVTRDEAALARGAGFFVDDARFDDEAYGVVVRSPHAHARLVAVDTDAARAAPGVLAVLTGADLAGAVAPLPCAIPLASFGGPDRSHADRAVLAVDRVRHVGDGVAFVVAETRDEAEAAAAAVAVTYDALPARLDARAPEAAGVWPEAPDDTAFEWRTGDADRCRALFAAAAHVVRLHLEIPRIAPYPIEPRAAVGFADADTGAATLLSNTQGVHFVRATLAASLGLAPERLRVVTPNVGGGFGSKIYAYPEHALVLHAARLLSRPVRWTATRSEALLADTQGRGHSTDAALALDAHGRFLALSVRPVVGIGAYLSQLTPATATVVGAPVQAGAYRFEAIEIAVRAVFTNEVPLDAFRGAGRPEATYVLERLIDRAADVLGIDPADLRARNLPDAQTGDYVTATGLVVSGGRFLDNQRRCLDAADRAGFPVRRQASEHDGMLRGFGFANYLEANGGLQIAEVVRAGGRPVESARLDLDPAGRLVITVGTQSTGQDHARPLVRLAAERLGLAASAIAVREGDSATLPVGAGTGGSKSLLTSTAALSAALDALVERATAIAAEAWGVAPGALRFYAGVITDAATGRRTSLAELAAEHAGALSGVVSTPLAHGSAANGCHAAEVEVDPDTGVVTVMRYTAVDDFGVVVDAQTVRGQVTGGVTQGYGQALVEAVPPADELTGLVAGAAPHYALAHAGALPRID